MSDLKQHRQLSAPHGTFLLNVNFLQLWILEFETLCLNFATLILTLIYDLLDKTSCSAMAERQRELGDFKGVGHFDAKF